MCELSSNMRVSTEKLDVLTKEMDRLRWNILGISELMKLVQKKDTPYGTVVRKET